MPTASERLRRRRARAKLRQDWREAKRCTECGASLDVDSKRPICRDCIVVRKKCFANWSRTLQFEVFSHYCNGKPHCQCPGCPFSRGASLRLLSIDHIDGKGREHKNSTGKQRLVGPVLWNYLKERNYPPGFQILCHTCNKAKGTSAACPCAGTDHTETVEFKPHKKAVQVAMAFD